MVKTRGKLIAAFVFSFTVQNVADADTPLPPTHLKDDLTTYACVGLLGNLEKKLDIKIKGGSQQVTLLSKSSAMDWLRSFYKNKQVYAGISRKIQSDYLENKPIVRQKINIDYDLLDKTVVKSGLKFVCEFKEDPFGDFFLSNIRYQGKALDKNSSLLASQRPTQWFDKRWAIIK